MSNHFPQPKFDISEGAFMNLMLNVIEAMKDSGGELTVKSKLQDGQLQFSVSDTGVGLPKEKMDQIFSAFFTTKPHSGMGLSISRSIVESHGGRLWATANNGRGATFHFTLPTAAETPQVPTTGVIRYPWGCLAVIQIETRASRPQKR
jgi:signal transduction histidine kinase